MRARHWPKQWLGHMRETNYFLELTKAFELTQNGLAPKPPKVAQRPIDVHLPINPELFQPGPSALAL